MIYVCPKFVSKSFIETPPPNLTSTADTCTAGTRDVVADKSMRADSPHGERVFWSRNQTIHCDRVHRSGPIHPITNQFILSCWLGWLPCERHRISCWANETARFFKTRSCRTNYTVNIVYTQKRSLKFMQMQWNTHSIDNPYTILNK